MSDHLGTIRCRPSIRLSMRRAWRNGQCLARRAAAADDDECCHPAWDALITELQHSDYSASAISGLIYQILTAT